MPVLSNRMKRRREETLLVKLGREQFEYMEMLEKASKIATPQDRVEMLGKLNRITALYMNIRNERAKCNTPAVASTK